LQANNSEFQSYVIGERYFVLFNAKYLTHIKLAFITGLDQLAAEGHREWRDAPYIQAGSEQSAVPLEATAENTFKIDPAPVFEFDASKGQMTIK